MRQGRGHVRQGRGHVELDAAVRGGMRRYGSVRGLSSSRDGVGSPVGVLLASNFERTPSAALRDLRQFFAISGNLGQFRPISRNLGQF